MRTKESLIANLIAEKELIPNKIRKKILKFCGVKIGNNSDINSNCYFSTPNVSLGDYSYIGKGCQFWGSKHQQSYIRIGNYCFVAMNVNFITSSHEIGLNKDCAIGKEASRAGTTYSKDISVGNGTWIGANVTILPGVKIGERCIIGAGSVVLRDCEDDCLYAGNPARKIKVLD
jgi:maltose O-acetyltransferase